MNSPALVVADEPTSDLDEAAAESLMSMMRRLADQGTALLVATHDRLAAASADRTLSMSSGRLD
jgi:ABC-type lipoprotein export system ATPase subunit